MEMKRCVACGELLPQKAVFCAECGARQPQPMQEPEAKPAREQPIIVQAPAPQPQTVHQPAEAPVQVQPQENAQPVQKETPAQSMSQPVSALQGQEQPPRGRRRGARKLFQPQDLQQSVQEGAPVLPQPAPSPRRPAVQPVQPAPQPQVQVQQPAAQSQPPAPQAQPPAPQDADAQPTEQALGQIEIDPAERRWRLITIAGVTLTAISVFLPVIEAPIVGLSLNIMTISAPLGAAIVMLCLAALYYLSKRKNLFVPMASNALLIFLLLSFVRYRQIASDLSSNVFGAAAAGAVNFGVGLYLLLAGTIVMSVAAVCADLMLHQKEVHPTNIYLRWRDSITQKLPFGKSQLHGFIVSMVIVTALVAIAINVNPFAGM